MSSYKATPEMVKVLRRRTIWNALPLVLLAAVVGVGIVVLRASSTAGLIFVVPVVIVVIGSGVFRSYKRRRQQVSSYEIRVTDEGITRSMLGVGTISIRPDQIVRIEKCASGQITIYTSSRQLSIHIPFEIERREELIEELSRWHAVEEAPAVRSSLWTMGAGIAGIAAFAAVALAKDPRVVVPVGSVLGTGLIVSAVMLWRSRQLDIRLRKRLFAVLVPILFVWLRVISALLGT